MGCSTSKSVPERTTCATAVRMATDATTNDTTKVPMTPNIYSQKESTRTSHRDTRCSAAALSEHASAGECQEDLSESSESDCEDSDATAPCRQRMYSDLDRRASTPAPAVQVGKGTFGDKDRFSEIEQTAGPGAYNLPALPATAGSGAGHFGQMTGERFETIEQTVGPGAYNLPALPTSAGAGNFGQMTGDRFETIEQTVGPGAYNLPALPTSGGAGNFGQMTGDRFETIDLDNLLPGPGAYTLPPAGEATGLATFATAERFEDIEETPGAGDYDLPTEKVVSPAAFSKSNVERLEEPPRNSLVGPGRYESPVDQPLPCNAKFSKSSRGLKKLRKRKQTVGPGSYNPRRPKQSAKGAFSKSQREVASYPVMCMW